MGGSVEGTAGAAAPIGTGAMKIALMVAAAMEGIMMRGIGTMMSEVGGPGAEARGVGGVVVGALVGEGIGAQLGKVVLKGEPKLSNGIGKGSRQNLLTRTTKVIVMMAID